MTTVCRTIIHPAASATAHATRAVGRLLHRHLIRGTRPPDLHPLGSHGWVEVVCRSISAAMIGGGLLLPGPAASPPASARTSPRPPPTVTAPAQPAVGLGLGGAGLGWAVAPEILPASGAPLVVPSGPPPHEPVPEPSSVALLLTGIAGLVGALAGRRCGMATASPAGSQACRYATHAGRHPPAAS